MKSKLKRLLEVGGFTLIHNKERESEERRGRKLSFLSDLVSKSTT